MDEAEPVPGVISIHAPARGATTSHVEDVDRTPVFQSTLPRGERLDCKYCPLMFRELISIHAPARGATYAVAFETTAINFNPRSREGSDGADGIGDADISDFNPRSREGSDLESVTVTLDDGTGFQSTLPRGERL